MKKLLPLLAAALLATSALIDARADALVDELADDLAGQRQAIFDRETAVFENKDDLSETERLKALIDMYFEYAVLEFPEFATFIGLPQGQDRWSDGSVAASSASRGPPRNSGLSSRIC